MTSESSSAILDLNDADTEDTEPPSVTDDGREGAPLIMDHGYDIAIMVDAPMKQLSTLETFVTYRVRCVCARWLTPPYVRRRYNHFKLLHKRLCSHPWVAPPPLPPLHTARQQLDRYSASFVALRTQALHAFLDRVARHPIFSHSEDFKLFVTLPDEQFDKVFKSENSALNLWGLSSALYGSGEAKPPANSARVKDPEWSSYAEYLTSLQQKLTTLCTLTNKLHKGTLERSNEMVNMKRACDAWSSQARGATARAAAAVATGAGASSRPPPLPRAHRALLPMLAAYTGAHLDKIRHRDLLHATYVSGINATGEMHNKLEQCCEALRSELSDWLPKTRAELKALLLDMCDAQVTHHAQVAAGWERALKQTQDANVEELFKTVSKTAVQNLSPSKCRSELTPTETERDLDDLDNYSNDSDSLVERMNERASEQASERTSGGESERAREDKNERISGGNSERVSEQVSERTSRGESERKGEDKNERTSGGKSERVGERMNEGESERKNEDKSERTRGDKSERTSERKSERKSEDKSERTSGDKSERTSEDKSERTSEDKSERTSEDKNEWVEVNNSKDPLNINYVLAQDKDFFSEILDDTEPSYSKDDKEIKDSTSLEQSLKSNVVSDPLKEFSDICYD